MNPRYRYLYIHFSLNLPFMIYIRSSRGTRLRMHTSAPVAFIPANRDFKFLPLYGSSDVCRWEVAEGKHSRGKALSRDSNRLARHGATFKSNSPYGSTGNTPSFRNTAFQSKIPMQPAPEKSTAAPRWFVHVKSYRKCFCRENRSVIRVTRNFSCIGSQ